MAAATEAAAAADAATDDGALAIAAKGRAAEADRAEADADADADTDGMLADTAGLGARLPPSAATVSVIMICPSGLPSTRICARSVLDPAAAVGRTVIANAAFVMSPVHTIESLSFAYSKSACGTNAISTCESRAISTACLVPFSSLPPTEASAIISARSSLR